ncbi:MAG: glycosyltransferase family 4 protein [Deltaproteobacteria bacterium]|nr:glycosyltransferase family 4 protein [Deltaproteobacteria bacterium]
MRLGIDATFFGSSQPTGLGIYTCNMINALIRIHKKTEIWASRDYEFSIDPAQLHLVLQRLPGLERYAYLLRPLWMETIFPKQLRESKIDILYSPVPGGMRHCPVPHLVTVHDLTPIAVPGDSPAPVVWNFRYRLPRILQNAAAVIAVSQHTKNDICSFYGIDENKIHVIHGAYSQAHFFPEIDPESLDRFGLEGLPYILAIGSANHRKNFSRLLKAISRIKNNITHHLVIAGPRSPAENRKIQKKAGQLGISDRLHLLPYLSNKELRALYSSADLFVYPSLYEGFGIPVLEAMACGTPVLAANTSSIPEVAGNAALLIDPNDTESIASGIIQIITNHDVIKYYTRLGLKRIQNFSWENSANRLIKLISTIKT